MQVGEAVSRLLKFPIGFYQKSKKMWIQNKQDLHDAWKLLERNKSLTLWCLGQDSCKKKHSEADLGSGQDDTSNSDDEATGKERKKTSSVKNSRTTSEEKTTKVQALKDELEAKHGVDDSV